MDMPYSVTHNKRGAFGMIFSGFDVEKSVISVERSECGRKVIFIDELPWTDKQKSLSALHTTIFYVARGDPGWIKVK